jgi:glycosyltransferase involved in cell wall biosynthesis
MQNDPKQATPVILTLNEEDNIGRTLQSLSWARRVVVVDSGSSDRTERIARSVKNVDWYTRAFDTHARQWAFAIRETGIASKYVLALDADMRTTDAFVQEMQRHFFPSEANAGSLRFQHWVLGRPIARTLVPPQLRIFQRDLVSIGQTGHTQVFSAPPPLYKFESVVIHDDRKPLDRWVLNQIAYSRLEHERLAGVTNGSLKDKLRRTALMPFAAAAAAYILAGGPLRGSSSMCYALERLTYESLLAMRLIRSGCPLNGKRTQYDE